MNKHVQYLKMLMTGIRLDNNCSNAYMKHKKYCVGVTMMNEGSNYSYCIKTCDRFCSCHRGMYKVLK